MNDFLAWLQTNWYWVLIAVAAIIFILKFIPRYKIAPPDTALIIYGMSLMYSAVIRIISAFRKTAFMLIE